MTILVTGASGFLGKNLLATLQRLPDVLVLPFDVTDTEETLLTHLGVADIVFHLAGVNRPEKEEDFFIGNADLTSRIVSVLLKKPRRPMLVLSSSTQAERDNPYGRSKREAERALDEYGRAGGNAVVLRLPNIFGKWSRPNYNSVVATFCYNISRGIDITITDPQHVVELIYIDDVVSILVELLHDVDHRGTRHMPVGPITKISLAELAHELYRIRDIRTGLLLPDMNDRFRRCLYATYLSFLPTDGFDYQLTTRNDDRGVLAEILRSQHFGQLFVSRTKPGIVRGNHFHNTKVEKFCVLEGEAVICFREISGTSVLSYAVKGKELRIVDIPPGYTHSIENVGGTELIVLFWSSEPFDPIVPDTYALMVKMS